MQMQIQMHCLDLLGGSAFLGLFILGAKCPSSQLPKLEGHATISILQVQKGCSLISLEASPKC